MLRYSKHYIHTGPDHRWRNEPEVAECDQVCHEVSTDAFPEDFRSLLLSKLHTGSGNLLVCNQSVQTVTENRSGKLLSV